MTDWKALCEELLGLWDAQPLPPYESSWASVIARTRAALAKPVGEPAPPAAGEVGELVSALRRESSAYRQLDSYRDWQLKLTRAADLLEQRHPAPVPAGMIPVEYWDIDSGARIVTEPSEEGPGGCWVVLNSHHISPLIEFSTAETAWNALQAAHALPLLPEDAQVIEPTEHTILVPVPVRERLPELRGMFERILCVARSSDQKPVGNIELADRLIKAVVSRAASGAALAAEPVVAPAGPTDEELRQMFVAHSMVILPDEGDDVAPLGLDAAGASSFARAVLARWGHQPAPPAEGEVGRLVSDHPAFAAWLAREMPPGTIIGDPYWWAPRIARRAADLLEHHPVPVPVAERPWEREGWCDEQGRCWWFCPESILPNGMLSYWCLGPATEPKSWFTHCLPFHALPLPGVEVE